MIPPFRFLVYDKQEDEVFNTHWFNPEMFDSKRMVVIDLSKGKRIIGTTETGFIYQEIEIDHL